MRRSGRYQILEALKNSELERKIDRAQNSVSERNFVAPQTVGFGFERLPQVAERIAPVQLGRLLYWQNQLWPQRANPIEPVRQFHTIRSTRLLRVSKV